MTWTPPSPTCVRAAWLVLGSLTVQLDNPAGGWFCSSLDLGSPDIRDVVSNRPDQDGVDDRTKYMGARVVSADITALAGAGARIDAVASSFAPFMQPSARPVLHYVLDRPGAAERTLTLRASAFTWPIAGPFERDIQLQWVAADPVVRDPVQKSSTAWSGSSGTPGRTYNLTFNRVYPAGGGSQTTGQIVSTGDMPVRPLLRIYGPITFPTVLFYPPTGLFEIAFNSTMIVAAGHYLEVDTVAKTVYMDGDHTQPYINQIQWLNTTWPVLPAGQTTRFNLSGNNTSGITQCQALWYEGYLS